MKLTTLTQVGAQDVIELLKQASPYANSPITQSNLSLPLFPPTPKIISVPHSGFNGQVERDIMVPVAQPNEEDVYYRQGNYGFVPDSRGSIVSVPNGHIDSHDYGTVDRARRSAIPLAHSPQPIPALYHNSESPTSYSSQNEVSVTPVSRINGMPTTSAPHINEDSHNHHQAYPPERQLPLPRPSGSLLPTLYDVQQRSSTFYHGSNTQWPAQYSCLRTLMGQDNERNSVSTYRSGSCADSNGYSLGNTSQTSISMESEYNASQRGNNGILLQPVTTLTETARYSDPVAYDDRKSLTDSPSLPAHSHQKPAEPNRDQGFTKDAPAYGWGPNFKNHSHGELPHHFHPLSTGENGHMIVKGSPAKSFPATNDLNQTSSAADTINVSNNATMSPKK
jgi:hypothetical protein